MKVTNDDMIAGALFDFAAWLTTRPKTLRVGASCDAGIMPPLIVEFMKMRGVRFVNPLISGWDTMLSADRKGE